MVGYRSMKRKESLASSPTNTVGTAGGRFEEYEAMKEELLETLRAGPGEAGVFYHRFPFVPGNCCPYSYLEIVEFEYLHV